MDIKPWLIGVVLAIPADAHGQDVLVLERCLRDGGICSETAEVLVDSSCGEVFMSYRGRLSLPPIQNTGPVTIAVQTRRASLLTAFPVYVEIATANGDTCETGAGSVVLEAQGTQQCGGIWESIGPIDLAPHSISPGGWYRVQLEFFAGPPHDGVFRSSVGVSCVRVTMDVSPVRGATWSFVKMVYH